MLSFDSIPQARLVRKGGRELPAPPMPRTEENENALVRNAREVVAVALGLWPLTAIVLLATGLLIMAGNNGAP